MARPMIRIHNQETDEIIDREMTKEEFDKYQETEAIYQAIQAKRVAEAEAKAQAKAALLERLGITEAEAKLLLA